MSAYPKLVKFVATAIAQRWLQQHHPKRQPHRPDKKENKHRGGNVNNGA